MMMSCWYIIIFHNATSQLCLLKLYISIIILYISIFEIFQIVMISSLATNSTLNMSQSTEQGCGQLAPWVSPGIRLQSVSARASNKGSQSWDMGQTALSFYLQGRSRGIPCNCEQPMDILQLFWSVAAWTGAREGQQGGGSQEKPY